MLRALSNTSVEFLRHRFKNILARKTHQTSLRIIHSNSNHTQSISLPPREHSHSTGTEQLQFVTILRLLFTMATYKPVLSIAQQLAPRNAPLRVIKSSSLYVSQPRVAVRKQKFTPSTRRLRAPYSPVYFHTGTRAGSATRRTSPTARGRASTGSRRGSTFRSPSTRAGRETSACYAS